jgi:hypothetical protein
VKKEHIPKQLLKYLRKQNNIQGNSLTSFFHIGDVIRLRLLSINLNNYQKAQFTMLPMPLDFINDDSKNNIFADTYADYKLEDYRKDANMTNEEAITKYRAVRYAYLYRQHQEKEAMWRRNKKYRIGNWKNEKPKLFNETIILGELSDEEILQIQPGIIHAKDIPKIIVDRYGAPVLPGEEEARLEEMKKMNERDFFRHTMNERFAGVPSEHLFNPYHCLSWWNGKPFIAPSWKNPYDENTDFVWEEDNNPRVFDDKEDVDYDEEEDDEDEEDDEEDEDDEDDELNEKDKRRRRNQRKRVAGGNGRNARGGKNEEEGEDGDEYDEVDEEENNEDKDKDDDDEEYEEDEEGEEGEEEEEEEEDDGYTYGISLEGAHEIYEDYEDPDFTGFFPRSNNTKELKLAEKRKKWQKHMNQYVKNQTKEVEFVEKYENEDEQMPTVNEDGTRQAFDHLPFHPISKEYKKALPLGPELEKGPVSDEAFWNRLYLIHRTIQHEKDERNENIEKELAIDDTPIDRDEFETKEEQIYEANQIRFIEHEINKDIRSPLGNPNSTLFGTHLDLTSLPPDILAEVKNSSFYKDYVQPELDSWEHWEKVGKLRYKQMCKKPIKVFNIKNLNRLIWDDYIAWLAVELPKDIIEVGAKSKSSRVKDRDRDRVIVTDPNEPAWITQEKERRRRARLADIREQEKQEDREAAGHGTDFSRSSRRH